VAGQANPEDNKISQDDTVTIEKPAEEVAVEEPAKEIQPPQGDDAVAKTPEENTEGKEETGVASQEEAKPEGEQQGHVLIPIQVPSPHLIPVVLLPPSPAPAYPGFVQLVPADNRATAVEGTEKEKEAEQPKADDAEGAAAKPEVEALEKEAETDVPAPVASDDDTASSDNVEAGSNDEAVSLDNPSLPADEVPEEGQDESKVSEAIAEADAGEAAVPADEVKVEDSALSAQPDLPESNDESEKLEPAQEEPEKLEPAQDEPESDSAKANDEVAEVAEAEPAEVPPAEVSANNDEVAEVPAAIGSDDEVPAANDNDNLAEELPELGNEGDDVSHSRLDSQ